ncbi:uncharacterized protein V6R79_009444 [Siganus canaliculatus]
MTELYDVSRGTRALAEVDKSGFSSKPNRNVIGCGNAETVPRVRSARRSRQDKEPRSEGVQVLRRDPEIFFCPGPSPARTRTRTREIQTDVRQRSSRR